MDVRRRPQKNSVVEVDTRFYFFLHDLVELSADKRNIVVRDRIHTYVVKKLGKKRRGFTCVRVRLTS